MTTTEIIRNVSSELQTAKTKRAVVSAVCISKSATGRTILLNQSSDRRLAAQHELLEKCRKTAFIKRTIMQRFFMRQIGQDPENDPKWYHKSVRYRNGIVRGPPDDDDVSDVVTIIDDASDTSDDDSRCVSPISLTSQLDSNRIRAPQDKSFKKFQVLLAPNHKLDPKPATAFATSPSESPHSPLFKRSKSCLAKTRTKAQPAKWSAVELLKSAAKSQARALADMKDSGKKQRKARQKSAITHMQQTHEAYNPRLEELRQRYINAAVGGASGIAAPLSDAITPFVKRKLLERQNTMDMPAAKLPPLLPTGALNSPSDPSATNNYDRPDMMSSWLEDTKEPPNESPSSPKHSSTRVFESDTASERQMKLKTYMKGVRSDMQAQQRRQNTVVARKLVATRPDK